MIYLKTFKLSDSRITNNNMYPFMLGILNAKIYNLDAKDFKVRKWSELENARYSYDFFKSRKNEYLKMS